MAAIAKKTVGIGILIPPESTPILGTKAHEEITKGANSSPSEYIIKR